MKYIFVILLAAVLLPDAGVAHAQQPGAPTAQVYAVVDEMPRFKAAEPGTGAMMAYLRKTTRYPAGAIQAHATGTVFVGFVVNPQGQVEQVKIAKGAHRTLDKEALRVVQQMPPWEVPGRQQGQPASVAFTVPIIFNMRVSTQASLAATMQKQLAGAENQAAGVAAGSDTAPVFAADPLGALNYINRQLQYPLDALRAKQQGTVLVAFVVDAEGKVTNARVVRGVFPSLDAEVLRVLESMPPWKPGTHEGKPAAVPLSDVPVSFRIK